MAASLALSTFYWLNEWETGLKSMLSCGVKVGSLPLVHTQALPRWFGRADAQTLGILLKVCGLIPHRVSTVKQVARSRDLCDRTNSPGDLDCVVGSI